MSQTVARGDPQVIVRTSPEALTGRSRQVSATARTRRDAEELLSRLLGEVGNGQHAGADVTMSELLERWYTIASPDWSPKTAVETRSAVARHTARGGRSYRAPKPRGA